MWVFNFLARASLNRLLRKILLKIFSIATEKNLELRVCETPPLPSRQPPPPVPQTKPAKSSRPIRRLLHDQARSPGSNATSAPERSLRAAAPAGPSTLITWCSLLVEGSSFTSVTNTHGIFRCTEPRRLMVGLICKRSGKRAWNSAGHGRLTSQPLC